MHAPKKPALLQPIVPIFVKLGKLEAQQEWQTIQHYKRTSQKSTVDESELT
jgi:hypothetical protein